MKLVLSLAAHRQSIQSPTVGESANIVYSAGPLNNNLCSQPPIEKHIATYKQAVIAMGHRRDHLLVSASEQRIVVRGNYSQIAATREPLIRTAVEFEALHRSNHAGLGRARKKHPEAASLG